MPSWVNGQISTELQPSDYKDPMPRTDYLDYELQQTDSGIIYHNSKLNKNISEKDY